MTLLDIILVSLSLGVDCFSVSVVCGAIVRSWQWSVGVRTAVLFGLFQALMPLLGWGTVMFLAVRFEKYGRWIAFSLLMFVGIKMVVEALRPAGDEPSMRPQRLATQLILAVATSIDALAMGVTLAAVGYDSFQSLLMPLAVIGCGSLFLALTGHELGVRFGRVIARRFRPELLGGIILIAIGVKVLCGG